jgi:transcriptional regulator with GAF, ATPase, and Fis domain
MATADKSATVHDPLAQQIDFISNLFSNSHLRKKYLSFVVENLKVWTGCQCVGIRVVDGNGAMPYDAFVGFSYEFWQNENWLSIKEHQCSCVRVATGQPDSLDLQILTKHGSLWTNDLNRFCQKIPDTSSNRYRCKCIEFGFASLAVIPLRFEGEVVGLIHLADPQKDMLPEDKMTLLESVSGSIAGIIRRYLTEEGLRAKEETFKKKVAEIKHCVGSISSTCSSAEQINLVSALQQKVEELESRFF